MAVMIPTDSYFDPASGEREMFEALKKLPDDYYIFHSYRLVQLIPDKGLNENEIDFLVFNPNYGCLFIECKNSKVERDENGQWYYVKNINGTVKKDKMKDPFDQAFSGQHNLFNKLSETYPNYRNLLNSCKFMVAVWFPKYTKNEIENIDFGPNVIKEVIMTREALTDEASTKEQIEFLMERMNRVHLVCKYEEEPYQDGKGYKHLLTPDKAMMLYNYVLCPTFRAVINTKKDYENTYIELLEEQYVVLDFLVHQRTAAISGSSGTGKTLVAIERAKRLSQQGNKVLFLCFNRNLMDYLSNCAKKGDAKETMKNVDFFTLDSFGCKICNAPLGDWSYYDFYDALFTVMSNKEFEYKHIIVDEGQDFGKDIIDDANILELLSNYGSGYFDDNDTSFFIFYDKNQLVNSKKIPTYLNGVDSKLTLYKNCRNTKNIAGTAYSLLDNDPILFDKAWDGDIPNLIFYSDEKELQTKLNNLLETLYKSGSSEKVIITCNETINNSELQPFVEQSADGKTFYKVSGKKTGVYTAATFKGLEADDVIVTDINEETFLEENKNFYVAATRARKKLFVFVNNCKINIKKVLEERFPDSFQMPDKEKQLAMAMHASKH